MRAMRLLRGLAPLAGAGALGAVAALGQAPFGLWPLTVAGLAGGLLLAARAGGAWAAAVIGWALGTGYFLLALVWIVQPFLVDPLRYGWMAPFALVFMAGGLALFWGLGFGLGAWVSSGGASGVSSGVLSGGASGVPSEGSSGGGAGWALICALTLAELARSYLFTGFPWALTGHVLVDTPLAQLAALGGAHLLGLAVLAAALALAGLTQRRWGLALGVFAVLAAGWLWGLNRPGAAADLTGRPVLRLVQPNAPQAQKWDPDFALTFFRRQVAYTAAGPARPDLIVWPETALPVLLDEADRAYEIIHDAAGPIPVILGGERLLDEALYNSAVVLGADGQPGQIYDKHHLVPFGEYIPLGDLAARWGLRGLAAKDGNGFAAGPGPRLLDLGPKLGRALPLICYEAVFPRDASHPDPRPDFLLQLTNDAWFGTFSGPYQHLAQARLRAIEQGLPLARAANTGISGMIDPWGRVTAQIALGQAGWVDAVLPPALPAPPYTRWGDWGLAALLAAILASIAGARAFGRRKPR